MEESMREEHSSKYSYFEMRNMWFPVKWHERRQSTDLKFLFSFKVESSPRKMEEPEKLQSKAFSPVKWGKPHGSKGQFQRSRDDRQGGLKPHSFLSTKIPPPVLCFYEVLSHFTAMDSQHLWYLNPRCALSWHLCWCSIACQEYSKSQFHALGWDQLSYNIILIQRKQLIKVFKNILLGKKALWE